LPPVDRANAKFWRTPPRKYVTVLWLAKGLSLSMKARGADTRRVVKQRFFAP
jgi:hypothetical protein